MRRIILSGMAGIAGLTVAGRSVSAQESKQSSADFEKAAKKLREDAIAGMEPQLATPTNSRTLSISARYPWKTGIVTTVFWIGRAAGDKAGSKAGAWDPKWEEAFGGFDDPNPKKRENFIPGAFTPRLNPFYIALPYNDVANGFTKSEARVVIPWFRDVVAKGHWVDGESVCRNRWLAIRNAGGKVCYAQWSDCGPFGTNRWKYVFGNEKPQPSANGGAGLNVSPAVRDYLDLQSTDVTDWKFVDFKDIPQGPWSAYGANNPFVQEARGDEKK